MLCALVLLYEFEVNRCYFFVPFIWMTPDGQEMGATMKHKPTPMMMLLD